MTNDEIARFLRTHPKFFDQHPELLETIYVPHPYGGRAIALSERQTVALREKVKLLEGKLAEIIKFAEENDAIGEKVHRLSVALGGGRDFPALVHSLYFHLREDFAVPHVALRVWGKSVPADFQEAEAVSEARRQQRVRTLVRRSCRARALARARPARPERGVRAARARERGPAALLPGNGDALPASHRRAMRGRSDGSALAGQYLDALRHQRRLSPATLTNYGHALQALFKLLKEGELASLDAVQVRRFVAVMHSRGLGPRSLALMLSAWRGFYHWLVRHHGFAANPVVGVRAPKAPRPLPKALSVEAAQRLLDEKPGSPQLMRDAAMFELMYSS